MMKNPFITSEVPEGFVVHEHGRTFDSVFVYRNHDRTYAERLSCWFGKHNWLLHPTGSQAGDILLSEGALEALRAEAAADSSEFVD